MMTRFSYALSLGLGVLLFAGLAHSTHASTSLTQQVLINFDGTLTGASYNLAPGEIDTTGTFSANGSATVSGGAGDIPGNLDPTTEGGGNLEGLGASTGSGFFFQGDSLGSLTAQNWVSEMVVTLDTPLQDQPGSVNPDLDPGLSGFAHLMGVNGDTFYRIKGLAGSKTTEYGYWDGGSEVINASDDPMDSSANHVALVWDAAGTSLTAYMNGTSQGSVDLNAFDVSSPRVGYGFFARFFNRAIDGKLDSVAFSTFDGSFDATSDFQLIPEPSSVVLISLAIAGVLGLKRT